MYDTSPDAFLLTSFSFLFNAYRIASSLVIINHQEFISTLKTELQGNTNQNHIEEVDLSYNSFDITPEKKLTSATIILQPSWERQDPKFVFAAINFQKLKEFCLNFPILIPL